MRLFNITKDMKRVKRASSSNQDMLGDLSYMIIQTLCINNLQSSVQSILSYQTTMITDQTA